MILGSEYHEENHLPVNKTFAGCCRFTICSVRNNSDTFSAWFRFIFRLTFLSGWWRFTLLLNANS